MIFQKNLNPKKFDKIYKRIFFYFTWEQLLRCILIWRTFIWNYYKLTLAPGVHDNTNHYNIDFIITI